MREEVGLFDVQLGPHIWNRYQLIPDFGRWDGQSEQIYLVEVEEMFEPTPEMTWEQLRAEYLFEIRWWSMEELSAIIPEGQSVSWIPPTLPKLIVDFASTGFTGGEPVQIGSV